jgi:cytochrome c
VRSLRARRKYRRRSMKSPAKAAVLVLAMFAASLQSASARPEQAPSAVRVLVFTKTVGFRHSSIPSAVQALRELGAQNGFTIDATDDSGAFTESNLARYAAVGFALTTGDVLNDAQQTAFERYIRSGHGFVGLHSASDTEYSWPWYGRLIGAFFKSHPAIQRATLDVADRRHPSTERLPRRWTRTDEWYNFATNPRRSVRVLVTLDETTYAPGAGAMGRDHPIAWAHEFEGGRSWYTGGGHTEESYAEPLFRAHLLGGVRYAAGLAPPQILSVTTRLRGRRVAVSAQYADCTRCAVRLQVRLPGRRLSLPMRLEGSRAQATTRALPSGRWTLIVSVKNQSTDRQAVVRRTVRIR